MGATDWRARARAHFEGRRAHLSRDLAPGLGMEGIFVALATGERVSTGTGGRSWQPFMAHLKGERGLYFSEYLALNKSQSLEYATLGDVQRGQWGLSLLTSLPIAEMRVEQLGRLRRERVSRALIVARLNDGHHSFYVLAVP